ncbi:cytochrome c-type biogenesis protein CcmE [Thalassobaculum fulvum]|jgi:cytochrome c-type biogenesis protein CcmE|uniref:Cytochrome c-type biogenesis protein CcmE n=1 Tax=Thalassobaculum fulvum TaxID=1633335 RepID=A0A918XPB3_9PROT|nr:cytochrome c maturation protein CcmE [Thalassobaculum fulvum]GHD43006.1 cytochrome c-type biogenesis protein CcmE [Thalassobaculum fulvum]
MSRRPYRSRKNRRLALVIGGLAFLGIAVALVLTAFQDSVVFFFSPTDLAAKEIGPDRRVRVGGLVEEGSVTRGPGDGEIRFLVTDGNTTLPIRYVGVLPDLFREGQGVVAQGRLAGGTFEADEVLAKHDENYMPPEVADALKKQGHWEPGKPMPGSGS